MEAPGKQRRVAPISPGDTGAEPIRTAVTEERSLRASASRSRSESRARLVGQYVANGNRLVDEGDLLSALPWFAKALQEEQSNPARGRRFSWSGSATRMYARAI